MSTIQSRYHNGVTNLGLVCGFATNTPDGHLYVLVNGCTETGWRVERTDGARSAQYPFEPIVAVCRMEPHADPAMQPVLRALHVTRMPRDMLPKRLVWMARDWPYNSPFTPFRERFHTYGFPEEFLQTLAGVATWPDWLKDAAEQDSLLDEMLLSPAKGSSNRYIANRWMLTGRAVSGPLTTPTEPRDEQPTPYIPLTFFQPGNPAPLFLRIPVTQRDAWPFVHRTQERDATVLFTARTQVLEHDGTHVLRSRHILNVREIFVPVGLDMEESAHAPPVFSNPGMSLEKSQLPECLMG